METNFYSEVVKASQLRTGTKVLENCHNKCITLDGDYSEKQYDSLKNMFFHC